MYVEYDAMFQVETELEFKTLPFLHLPKYSDKFELSVYTTHKQKSWNYLNSK